MLIQYFLWLQVYNETIRDLLCPSGQLAIREDANQGVVISKLSKHEVATTEHFLCEVACLMWSCIFPQPKSARELLSMLESGNRRRTQHPTEANASSSRSHAVFQVSTFLPDHTFPKFQHPLQTNCTCKGFSQTIIQQITCVHIA